MTNVSLLEALLRRRSRRFGKGMQLESGPLAFQSRQPARPLTLEHEAMLAFAAVGITGPALGEMEYTSGAVGTGGGNVLASFVGRTAASADAIQSVGLVIINDEGTWYVPRPQDLPAGDLPMLVDLAHRERFTEWYERIRVRLNSGRVTIPDEPPFTPSFNRWDTNTPGTTVFLPIIETTALFINCLLTALSEEMGIYILDDGLDKNRNTHEAAGLKEFGQENPLKPGHLRSDGKAIGFVVTITQFEMILLQCVSAELGGILQNLALMAQALGLGGFTHAAHHPIWLLNLGFVNSPVGYQEMMGVGEVPGPTLEAMGYSGGVPTFASHEPWIRSYCPPAFPTMSAAVDAFVDSKYGRRGAFRGGAATAWKDSSTVEQKIAPYSTAAIAATKSYCEFVFGKYERFPTLTGPISTLLAYQAHQLDTDFYDRFYNPGVLP